MELEEQQQQQQQQQQIVKKSNYISKNSCYDTFLYSLSIPETKRRYTKNLREFLDFATLKDMNRYWKSQMMRNTKQSVIS